MNPDNQQNEQPYQPQTPMEPQAPVPQYPPQQSEPMPQPTQPEPAPQQPQPQIKVDNPLAVMQPGESIICEIRRHPIGIIGTYIMAAIVVAVVAVLAFVVAPMFLTSYDKSQVLSIGALIFILVALANLGFVWAARTVYRGNRWIITSDSLTQVTQTSLFDKKSSQLSLANLEDITAEQNGVFAHMYNYGVLRAETAGERSKFMLMYCPNPNYYAQQILDAREKFEQFGGRRGTTIADRDGINLNTQG